jgi:hypothetical protein
LQQEAMVASLNSLKRFEMVQAVEINTRMTWDGVLSFSLKDQRIHGHYWFSLEIKLVPGAGIEPAWAF